VSHPLGGLYRQTRTRRVAGVGEQFLELWITAGQDPRADDAEIEQRTLALREELLEIDVQDVRRPLSGPAPEGARAGEATLHGALIVTVAREAIGAVVRAVAGWLSRGDSRTVRLQLGDDSIELTDVSAEDQRQLLHAFLARHG
jgi:hypothetical protein